MAQVDRINGLVGTLGMKAPCRVATTANITLSGEQTIDGVAVVAGDRVLVKNQTESSQNGIYDCSTTAWTRAADFDGPRDVLQGTQVPIALGSTLAGSTWRVTSANPVTIGTSNITFVVATTAADVANAAASAAAALVSETNAATSETNAATSETNAATSETNAATSETNAATSETNAAASELSAAASAASAAAIAGAFVGTSTTSVAIGTGSKSFTTQTGEQYTAGVWMSAVSASSPTNWMFGQVTSYSGNTLILDIQAISGSGSYADWNLSLTGARGPAGNGVIDQAVGFLLTGGTAPKTLTVDDSVSTSDLAKLSGATYTGGINEARGSVAMHATTMNIWAQPNIMDGTGSPVTITAIANAPQAGARRVLYPPTGTIITNGATFAVDGSANYTTASGDKLEFEAITTSTYKVHITKKNGSAITSSTAFSIVQFTTSGTWTKSTGLKYVKVTVVAGGGGGGGGVAGVVGGRGGAGGGASIKYIAAATLGSTETVTVGTGGAGAAPSGTGTNGGTSSFGAHCSATGGNGGPRGDVTSAVAGGTGSSGTINLSGQNGGIYHGNTSAGGIGGCSPIFSGGGVPGSIGAGENAKSNSGGGGGGGANGYSGGNGADGICIVEEFY